MFDIGWTEMLVVAVVAIIVVGPKDLPGMLRSVGRSIKKVRGMAGDFQRQFDDALKEAELDGVKKSIDEVRSLNPLNKIKDSINPLKDVARELDEDINGELNSGQADDENYSGFDPGELFDETKLAKVSEPVKVDVDAALAREKAKTAKKTASKSKAKAGAAKAVSKTKATKSGKPETKAKSPAPAKPATAKSAVAKKPATKSAATKTAAAKPRTSKPKAAKAKSTRAKTTKAKTA